MNRIAPKEYTVSVFGDLLNKINEFSIAITIHYLSEDKGDCLGDAKKWTMKPDWGNVAELLDEIKKELEAYRVNPVKYY